MLLSPVFRRLYYRPSDADLDEFHPRATRILYVGNLSSSSLQAAAAASSSNSAASVSSGSGSGNQKEVHDKFSPFGEILEMDVKPKGGYACVQYADVSSVCKAIRACDGHVLGDSSARVMKLGFGRAAPTKCVWVSGVATDVKEKDLYAEFGKYGKVQDIIIHNVLGLALIWFDQVRPIILSSSFSNVSVSLPYVNCFVSGVVVG